MRITKRSRRKSEVFESRFRDGSAVNFPLRQYLRCREDFTSGLVHLALLVAFAVMMVFFGRTLMHLFDSHGAHLSPWYRRGVLALVGLLVLSVVRRIWNKVIELRETREAMRRYQADFGNSED